MSKAYDHILSAVASEIWAMDPVRLKAMVGFLQLKAAGESPEPQTLAQIHAASVQSAARTQTVSQASGGSVAVLPLFGMIMPRGNMMGDISGPRGTSIDQFTQSFRRALNDPSVRAIVLDIDSPGGSVSGVAELATEILAARKTKPIIAVSDGLCASAAYWIASACTEVVASPSSLTGSIGVFMVHKDISAALDREGVKLTLISHGAHKADSLEFQPLGDDARADLQATVSYFGGLFDTTVGKGRKMSAADVQQRLGGGKVFNALKAKSSGMVDRVATLDQVLAEYGVSRGNASSSRAAYPAAAAAAAVPATHPAAAVTDAPSATAAKSACVCPCDGCVAGDCGECDTEDCGFDGCGCGDSVAQAEAAVPAQAAVLQAHRERELQLLTLA